MKSWYFSEQSYYPAWQTAEKVKITSPSSAVDPAIANGLLQEYLEQCRLVDELGLNIMVNEHHASYTCMSVSCLLTLGILASQTRKARLLALGVPILNRLDPFRIAEEAAYVDVLSRGRLELGLIKGSPFELYVSNANPVTAGSRYWEAHDMVTAALTHRDGPFSWQSEHFNYRNVNVIPRCYQQPTPPMWLTTLSTRTAIEAARRGLVLAITGVAHAARASFPLYRDEFSKVHGRPAPLDRLAYLGYIAVAKDEKTARERARKILRFPETSERIQQDLINPPGTLSHEENARFIKARTTVTHREKTLPDGTPMSNPPTVSDQIANQVVFAGTPDQVYEQIKRFYDSVGGFGHLLVQKGGVMAHDEICESLRLFANEVQPRLDQLVMTQEKAVA
jgi:alkanesulfonate monooxygenase SsuD/methylene tetrahydromethanopterin reductase-like flavin-dependent oxidoreductase (luciferase family)